MTTQEIGREIGREIGKDSGATVPPRRGASASGNLAGVVGNLLEWYDFAVYGFLATTIARSFFPAQDEFVSLMGAFGVFAASYLMRPIGGILFGHVGDRFGRGKALVLSAGLMTFSTVAIGLLPTYEVIGHWAAVLIIAMRLLQGISVGGEYPMSAVFLCENAGTRWRGFITSLTTLGVNVGLLLGSCVAAGTAILLTPEQLADWGWRVPFLLGVLLGAYVLMVRRSLGIDDPPERAVSEGLPLLAAVRNEGARMVHACLIALLVGVFYYVVFVYLTTYLQQEDGFTERTAFVLNSISLSVQMVACLAFAALSDRLGRKRVQLTSLVVFLVVCLPLFRMLDSSSWPAVLFAQLVLGLLFAGYAGPMQSTLVEMFRRETRCSALALTWNVAVGVVGGAAPVTAVYLVHYFQSPLAPAYMLMAVGGVSLVGLALMEDRTGTPV